MKAMTFREPRLHTRLKNKPASAVNTFTKQCAHAWLATSQTRIAVQSPCQQSRTMCQVKAKNINNASATEPWQMRIISLKQLINTNWCLHACNARKKHIDSNTHANKLAARNHQHNTSTKNNPHQRHTTAHKNVNIEETTSPNISEQHALPKPN